QRRSRARRRQGAAGLPREGCGDGGMIPTYSSQKSWKSRCRSCGTPVAVSRAAARVAAVKETVVVRGKLTLGVLLAVVVVPGVAGCGGPDVARRDHIHQTELRDIRLGDGVPLAFSVSIRWRVEDARAFTNQFSDPARYASLVLEAKSREVAGKV